MSWAKFDDRYDDNRKVKRAWRSHPRAVGLHAMAVTYSARHETDGLIDIEWLEDKLPSKVEREKCLVALLKVGLFERVDDEHFRIHDYLDYNDSRETLSGRRDEQREKKRQAGRKGAEARWGAKSDSSTHGSGNSNRIAGAMADAGESMAPDPTRPDPTYTGTSVPDARTSGTEGEDATSKADPDDLPDDLPDRLHESARQVQQRLLRLHDRKPKSIRPALGAIGRVLVSMPDRDHVAVADDVELYWTFGAGQNKSMRDLVATYRNRLSTAPVVAPGRPGGGSSRNAPFDVVLAAAERREREMEQRRAQGSPA